MASVWACACLIVFAGCGTSGSEREVDSAVDRFQAALTARDGVAACAELTTPTRDELASQEGKPCPRAVLAGDLSGGGRAAGTRVYMTSALTSVPGHGYLFLDETSRGWRISAAGCKPTPRDQPYDCEVKD